MPRTSLSRRNALTVIAVSASGVMVPRALFAQGNDAVLLPQADVCTIMPEVTEGPYYIDPGLIRRDIREDREGVPVLLRMQVVDQTCTPIEGARVDVWHCDAQGVYSAFGGGESGQTSAKSETFLRGTQMGDARGVVEFDTIYPGWYRGRTTHMHYKVFLDETNVLTGQIFFPDGLSEYIYANVDGYIRSGERDTVNDNDGIAAQASRAAFASIKEDSEAYLVQLVVGVDPAAQSVQRGQGGAPMGPPPGTQGMRREVPQGPFVPGQDG